MKNLTLNSYAKVNLYLEVLNKRRDGYHSIKTIFERISLCDQIILRPRPDKKVRIICNSPLVPKGASNTACRSAKLLQETFAVDKGVDIKIIKRIPVGAGLGGGSSNAAFVLLGLNKLWKLNLSRDKLVGFAKKIGCDVPFFLYDTPFAQGLGRGDKIIPLKGLGNMRLWHILVVPKVHVSTPVIYKKWDIFSRKAGLTKIKSNVNILNLALKRNDPYLLGKVLYNSLEEVTAKLYPVIKQVKDTLSFLGLKIILMSGSGPAVFGVVSSGKEAVILCKRLKKESRLWQVFVVRTA